MANDTLLGESVITGIVFFAMIVVVAKLGGSFGAALGLALAAACGAYVLLYNMRERCPSCESRAGRRWLHRRVDGGPDRRFRDNEAVCTKCLASWPLPRKP